MYTAIGYQNPVEFYSLQYETLESKYLGNPDYRTTLYWKPNFILSDEGKASFDFYTYDFQTTNTVALEDLSVKGQIILQVAKIEVR